MIIAVIGGETCTGREGTFAYEAGREIANRGHVLICGGRGGVMREACRGAKDAGGMTIGVLPGEDTSDMNEFVDVPIVTGLGFARNTIIARSADALIAIGGRYGTLSEIAFAFIANKPVVAIESWELVLPTGEPAPIPSVSTAPEAVGLCERLATKEQARVDQ